MTLTEDQRKALSLFTFWWRCIESDAELAFNPIRDDSLCLHFSGSSTTAMVFAKELRAVVDLLETIQRDAP